MEKLKEYFWYSLLSLETCCELVLNVNDDVDIKISNIENFYSEYDERTKTGINTSEDSRLSVIRRVLSLCYLMSRYNYYPDDNFLYKTNDQPGCKLLIYVPNFSVNGNVENIKGFIHYAYVAPFYTTPMEDTYLRQLGHSDIFIKKLKNRSMDLDELCENFGVDMSETLSLYRKSRNMFNVYSEDKCIKDFASVIWACYVDNNLMYHDDVRFVSVIKRKAICMNLCRYLIIGELMFADEVDEKDQIKIMVLMVVSRNMTHFPDGFVR